MIWLLVSLWFRRSSERVLQRDTNVGTGTLAMHEEITTGEARTGRFARFVRLGAALRAGLRHTVDIALPNLCPACRESVGDQGLCAACWSKLSFIAPPYCER